MVTAQQFIALPSQSALQLLESPISGQTRTTCHHGNSPRGPAKAWFLLFQDKRWPCPILDGPPCPVLTEALMQESSPKFLDDVSSLSTANPQENERVPHVQDFLAVPATLSPATEPNEGLAKMEPVRSHWTSCGPVSPWHVQVGLSDPTWCQPYLVFVHCEQPLSIQLC